MSFLEDLETWKDQPCKLCN